MFQVSSCKFQENGAASLLTVLTVASFILTIGVALASGGFVEIFVGGGQVQSDEIFAAAEAGAKDALIRLSRNKNYSSAGYNLSVGSASVIISVENVAPSSCAGGIVSGQVCVVSAATLGEKTRRIEVVANIDSNGKTTQQTWKDL